MTDKIVVLTTCESEEQARPIAESLVALRLAACVQILPQMRSVYRWKGKVESATEVLVLIKTRRALLPRVSQEIEKLHPYDLPEVIALPVVDGLGRYLEWLDEQTEPQTPDDRVIR